MRRRDFLTFLGCSAAWVSTARGEEPSHVVGFLSAFFAPGIPGALAAFYQGLKETGFVEGKNISIEFRWADGHYDRLPTLAAKVDLGSLSTARIRVTNWRNVRTGGT